MSRIYEVRRYIERDIYISFRYRDSKEALRAYSDMVHDANEIKGITGDRVVKVQFKAIDQVENHDPITKTKRVMNIMET